MALDEATRAEGSAAVRDRLGRLQTAVEAGGNYFDPFVAARAQEDLRRAHDRMQLGTDLTVVALVGGTGSGKSTLFNAITGLQFADSGELRPTTDRAAACVYNADATDLLDYLEVDPARRIEHTSILTEGTEDLDGLVLLDLPDHDSVRVGHSMQVERLIPMVDTLIWVLDPQKYADQILHQNYLTNLATRRHNIVVVLNQVDTIDEAGTQLIIDDLRALLAKDGLDDVPVLPTSALEGIGIEAVLDELRKAIHGPSATALTAASELDAIAGRLTFNIGSSEADVRGRERDEIIDRISEASGVPAVAQSVRNAGHSLSATALVEPQRPGNSMVTAVRDTWTGYVKSGLPTLWQEAAVANVASPERIRSSIGSALKKVDVPQVDRSSARVMIGVGVVTAIVALVLAIIGVPSGTGARLAIAIAGLAIGVGLYFFARRQLASQADEKADRYQSQARAAIADVVDETLVVPTESVIEQHKVTREALESFK